MAERFLHIEAQVIASLENRLVSMKLENDTNETKIFDLLIQAHDSREAGDYKKVLEISKALTALSEQIIKTQKSMTALELVIADVIDGKV